MKKIIVLMGLFLLILVSPLYASEMSVYTALMDTNSGVSMGGTGSGISLIGTVDIAKLRPSNRTYSIQLDTVELATGGTGLTGDAGKTVGLCYGISNTDLTATQWEVKGTTGTTVISLQAIGSGSSIEPHNFTPEFSNYLAIFSYSGSAQFYVPKAYFVGQ